MTRTFGAFALLAFLLSACAETAQRDFSRSAGGPHFGGAAVTGGSVRGPG